jgi:hypothetical protein
VVTAAAPAAHGKAEMVVEAPFALIWVVPMLYDGYLGSMKLS